MRGRGYRADTQVEPRAQQHGGHAAEAIQKGLGNPAPQEWHANREAADQHRCRTDRRAEFDQTSLDPGGSGHPRKRYSVNIRRNQGKRPSASLSEDDGIQIPASIRRAVARARVGHFATQGSERLGLIPVCYVLLDETLYHAIDAKPKRRADADLARVANIRANPNAALLVDHYDEDWRRLWYALFRGRARILDAPGIEHHRAIVALRRKYPQYRSVLPLAPDAMVIALDVEDLSHWQASSAGRLRADRLDRRA